MKIFDKLIEAAQESPEAFENMREVFLEEFIKSLPEHQKNRAKGLQFTIDIKLNSIKNPTERYNKMIELFWEGLFEFEKALKNPSIKKEPAKIIQFRP